jgi:hypothetical protein
MGLTGFKKFSKAWNAVAARVERRRIGDAADEVGGMGGRKRDSRVKSGGGLHLEVTETMWFAAF